MKNNYRNLSEYKLALKFEQDNVSNKIQVAIEIAEKAPELVSNAMLVSEFCFHLLLLTLRLCISFSNLAYR